ncbi:DUF4153 domain-containing protein [Microbulbifer sp. SAOS-129_SWC]|uniref:DUF4153 domain-containing protein n=1 Tax=Microbulbifer sp. SAOS-129_SWC TaxID=3145235 RepID=UPI003216F2ED
MQGSADTSELSASNRKLIFATALLQGLLVYLLQAWPAVADWSPLWRYLSFTLVLALPPMAIVSVAPRLARSYWWLLLGYGALLALLAAYRGSQCTPDALIHCKTPLSFILSIGIASFIAAFLLRACATGSAQLRRPDYPALFHFSWDNALTAALTLTFVAIFWLILFLWQALFKLVGINFFQELFRQDWFAYPVSWLVGGCGAILFRAQQGFVLTLKRLLRTMLVALLPLLAVLVIVFLATLPATGLQPVWDTGRGSALLLWLVALLLFFTNGVIQDEQPFSRYPKLLNRILLLALAVAPIYALIAHYGLYLRVVQYGWTPERLWGFTAALTLTLVALSYCLAILRRGAHWTGWLRKLNTGLAFWVLAVCLVTQSPLADFWKISADSQVARLQDGRVAAQDFDFYFLRRHLGRPGLEAIQQLAQRPEISADAKLASYLGKLQQPGDPLWKLRDNPAAQAQRNAALAQLPIYPEGATLPVEVTNNLQLVSRQCSGPQPRCFWLRQDINGDGVDETLLFAGAQSRRQQIILFTPRDSSNDTAALAPAAGTPRLSYYPLPAPMDFAELRKTIASGNFRTAPTRWQALYAGDTLLFDPGAR